MTGVIHLSEKDIEEAVRQYVEQNEQIFQSGTAQVMTVTLQFIPAANAPLTVSAAVGVCFGEKKT